MHWMEVALALDEPLLAFSYVVASCVSCSVRSHLPCPQCSNCTAPALHCRARICK